jgi:hypothetical protein
MQADVLDENGRGRESEKHDDKSDCKTPLPPHAELRYMGGEYRITSRRKD